jgi:hypothetical protein
MDTSNTTNQTTSGSAPHATSASQMIERLSETYKGSWQAISSVHSQMKNEMTPRMVAEARTTLSSHYSYFQHELAKVEVERAFALTAMRAEHASDAATERAWETTWDGVRYIWLRRQTKALEKDISALKGLHDIQQGEMRNNY